MGTLRANMRHYSARANTSQARKPASSPFRYIPHSSLLSLSATCLTFAGLSDCRTASLVPIRSMDTAPQALARPSTSSSPTRNPLKKLLAQRSRTSLNTSSNENVAAQDQGLRRSGDSSRDGLASEASRRSSRDDGHRPSSSAIRKLIPKLTKRKNKKKQLTSPSLRGAESPTAPAAEGANNTLLPPSKTSTNNRSASSLLLDDNSSLLTDDSEPSS